MAHSFSVNNTPATGSVALYLFITTLVAAGWTKPRDSDGTTYSATGVQVTSGAAGANGLANSNAWFVVRDPNTARSFCFQRGTTNRVWRIKYSYAAGFIGGAPSATQVPSATDETVITGGGTDAAPTFATNNAQILPIDNTYQFNMCAGDSTVGYGFWWDSWTTGLVTSTHYAMMLDVMLTGSFPAVDLDAAAVAVQNGSGNGVAAAWSTYSTECLGYVGGADVARAWFNSSGTLVWKVCPAVGYADPWQGYQIAHLGAGPQIGAGVHAKSADDSILPICYARHPSSSGQTGPFGWKGFGQLIKTTTKGRANGDTLTVAGLKAWLYMNGTLLPWNNTVPTL